MQPSQAQRLGRRVARPAGAPQQGQRRPGPNKRGGPQGQRRPMGQRRPVGPQGQQRRPVGPQGQQRRPQQGQRPQQPQQKFDPFSLLTGALKDYKFGKVRKVVSGDTIIVETIHKAQPVDPKDKQPLQIQLDGVSCPHVTRSKNDQKSEECFGWEAREFLRKRLIGAFVIYRSVDLNSKGDPNFKGDRRRRRERGQIKFNLKDAYKPPNREPVWKDVSDLMVENGWANVKGYAFQQDDMAAQQRKEHLEALEVQAREGKRGQHVDKPENDEVRTDFFRKHTRIVDWTPNHQTLFTKHKGKQITAIVDDVRDGSTIKCEIVSNDEKQMSSTMVFIHLSGSQCRSMPKPEVVQRREAENRGMNIANFKAQKPSPLAIKAMQFTKFRLLGQEIKVTLDAIDNSRAGNLFGTVNFVKGDIAALLLRGGLAEVTEWTASIVGKQEKYNKIQEKAQSDSIGIWKEQKVTLRKKEERVFIATVHSGDQVYYRVEESITKSDGTVTKQLGEEQKVFLGSIQCPSLGNRRMGKPPAPYAWEAKEYVRSKLIGQYVNLKNEYRRTMNMTRSGKSVQVEAVHVTITYTDATTGMTQNISEELMAKGLAKLIPHGKQDKRVANYYQLTEMRNKARDAKLGIHGDNLEKAYKVPQFDDMYSNQDSKEARYSAAKDFAEHKLGLTIESGYSRRNKNLFGREDDKDSMKSKSKKANKTKKIKAVIDYVASANRLKVRIPEHKTILALHLTGVRCPRTDQDRETAKRIVIGKEALKIVKSHVLQREVWVVIENCDNYGNFIGHCITDKNLNIGLRLLRGGYGEITNRMSVENSSYKELLEEAETLAKEEKLGVWLDWTPPAPKPERAPREQRGRERNQKGDKREEKKENAPHSNEGKTINVFVTHLESGTAFFGVEDNEDKKAVESYMATVNPKAEDNAFKDGDAWEVEPGKQEVVACLFEGSYYRAKVSAVKKDANEKMFKVIFIDFGNADTVPDYYVLQIRNNAIRAIPPLAVRCELAGLSPPPKQMERYFQQAGANLSHLVKVGQDIPIQCTVVKANYNRRRLQYEVKAVSDGIDINNALLQDGLIRVDARRSKFVFENDKEALKELKAASKKAVVGHKGMYLYGDLDSDDEDDDKKKKGRFNRR